MKLDTMAKRYNLMEFEPAYSRGMRLMPVDNYAVIYIVKSQKGIITNILCGASDIQTKLK